jgi:hypothetical protein
VKKIQTGIIDSVAVDGLLYLATGMRNPLKPATALLQKPAAGFGKPENLTIEVGTAETVKALNTELSDRAKKLAERRRARNSQAILENTTVAKVDAAVGLSKESQAAAYCYLAAYIMRLHSRTSSSFVASLRLMQSRYASWYSEGSEIVENFEIEEDTAEAIKGMFSKRPNILHTWIMWVAYNENLDSLDKNGKGLMEYLAGQIFAYTGLHAVTQTQAIQQATNCDMQLLLTELEGPMTRTSVMELYNLLKNHEITSLNPNRKTFFRYARNWDAAYFAPLQTKRCIPLVYLTAKVYKLVAPSGAKSDPMKIFGLSDVGLKSREQLDRVADKLASLLIKVDDDGNTGSSWFTD